MADTVSRRDLLKSLALGSASSSALALIPLGVAGRAHKIIQQEKAENPAGDYTPKFFSPHQYTTLQALCEAIIPPDDRSGGAIEAGAPEFIDLLTSENESYQLQLGGGLTWLDATCEARYQKNYRECTASERDEILARLAFRENSAKEPSLSQGINFFALLRNLTTDGFYTSKIGIEDLQYLGNVFVAEYPGCPPVPKE